MRGGPKALANRGHDAYKKPKGTLYRRIVRSLFMRFIGCNEGGTL